MATDKPVHTVVLDTGAIIKNEPSVSTLLSKAESLITVPAIISEIKDAATRSRVETTLTPFLTLRTPSPDSIKFVTDFARRTGDLVVLSKPDIQIIALTYEIECERNGGDWRLRRVPGQKRVNGAPPTRLEAATTNDANDVPEAVATSQDEPPSAQPVDVAEVPRESKQDTSDLTYPQPEGVSDVVTELESVKLDQDEVHVVDTPRIDSAQNSPEAQEDSDSGSDGWITPGNLKKKQAEDASASTTQATEPKTMQVAVLTSDFAMQNVILQINLNLLSPSLSRIKQLKTYVLRCHACFNVVKDLTKQFCPRCGQPSLTRVSCSTSANGEFKLHLKKNMQWNHRGDRFSIPKPVHGSSHGRVQGGGKGGWGNELILAEDQKEYVKATQEEGRRKETSLMDEDYLPRILTGQRGGRAGGRPRDSSPREVKESPQIHVQNSTLLPPRQNPVHKNFSPTSEHLDNNTTFAKMASSSTRSTSQETRLLICYKHAVTRLHLSGLFKEAAHITYLYCDILDCTEGHLSKSIYRPWPDADFCLQAVKNICLKQQRSESVHVAAECLSDTAIALTRFGRTEEAGLCTEWALWLEQIVQELKVCGNEAEEAESWPECMVTGLTFMCS